MPINIVEAGLYILEVELAITATAGVLLVAICGYLCVRVMKSAPRSWLG